MYRFFFDTLVWWWMETGMGTRVKRAAKLPGRNGTRNRNGTAGGGSRAALLEALSAPPGEQLLRTLARGLAVALDARIGFVSKVTAEPGYVRLLAIWNGEEFGETFAYPTEKTPCERVLGKKFVHIARDVQKRYPEDAWLEEIGAQAYLAVPLFGSDGTSLGHLGVVHDHRLEVSSEVEQVLHAFASRAAGELEREANRVSSEETLARLSGVVNGAPVGILCVDDRGTISTANPRTERMFGYERGELVGKSVETLVPGGQRRRHAAQRSAFLRDPIERPMGDSLDTMGRRKDGTTFPVAIALAAAPDGGATAFISDATRSRLAAEGMEQNERRLEAVIAAFPEMTFIMDGEGIVKGFSGVPGLETLMPPSEFLGKSAFDVLPKDVAETLLKCIQDTLKTGVMQRHNYELELPDGKHSYEDRIVRLDPEAVVVFVKDLRVEESPSEEGPARPDDGVERRMEWKNDYGLSYREFSVLDLLKNGTTDKEIAEQLGISVYTVNKHVSNILGKMSAVSRTEATIRALQEGLIS